MRKAFLALTLAAAGIHHTHASEAANDLKREQAERLVTTYLVDHRFVAHMLVFAPNGLEPEYPAFFLFDVSGISAAPGSSRVGAFGVNKTTGDVWDTVECRRLKSRSLTPLQKEIRQANRLSKDDWRKRQLLTPPCLL